MSEHNPMSEYDPVSTPVDNEFALDEWIAGATVSKRSVRVYGKAGLFAEYEDLERDLAVALAVEKEAPGEMVGRESARIEQRMTELHEEWKASESTWTVRALTSDEVKECLEAEPALKPPTVPTPPVAPPALPAKHTDHQARVFTVATQAYEVDVKSFQVAVDEYLRAMAEYQSALNIRLLAKGVERVEFGDGRVAHGITAEQLLKLRGAVGDLQISRLSKALTEAAATEPEVPAPFSLGTSGVTPI